MLTIEVTTQGNGWTFRLSPESRALLREGSEAAAVGSSVFIGTETRRSYEDIHGPMWMQIALLLTGLSPRQLDSLGGFQVVDARTGHRFAPPTKSDAA